MHHTGSHHFGSPATALLPPELGISAGDFLHATTFLSTHQFTVGAFVASPSMGALTLPWVLDYAHLVFWFFFLTSFILGVWLAQTFYLGARAGEARAPIRETRGQSRAQTGDGITAVIPMSWSITMLMHANTHSSNFDENTSNAAFTCTVIAYQWGWNYYFPRDVVESVWGRATPAVEERAQQAFLRQTGAGGAYGVYPPFNTLSPSSLFAQAQGSNWGEGPGWVNLGLQYEGEPGTRPLSAAWALPGALLSTESAQSGEVALGDTTPAMGPLLGELETHTTDLNAGPTRPVGGAALVGARSLLGEAHTGAVLSEGVYTMPVEVRTTLRAAAVALVEGGGPEVVTPLVIPMGGAEEQTAMVWHNNPYQALAQGLEPNPLGLELLEWAPKAPTSAQSWEGWGAATSFQLMAPLAATLPAPFDDLDPVYAGTRWAPEVTTTRQSAPWAVDETQYGGPVRRMRVTSGVLLPSDIPIHLICGSKDVIHSWAIPGLGIKIDCIPGYNSHRRLLLRWRGLFWGQCMEVCGRYHHWMPILVRVVHVDVFCMWALATFRLVEGAEVA